MSRKPNIQHERVNVSLHHYTLKQVQTRVLDHTVSHVIDRDLIRYYTMVQQAIEDVITIFTSSELKEISKAVFKAPLSRNLSLQMLRLHVVSLSQQKTLSEALAKRISELSDCQFLGLMDHIEYVAPKKSRRGP